MTVLEIENLKKNYRGKRRQVVSALRGLNLKISKGEVFGFLGPNGAGKSTTIRLLMGLISRTSGSARICGVDCSSPKARCSVGYLPENPAFYDFLSAREYLYFVSSVFKYDKKRQRQRIDEVLELFELSAAAKRPIRGYSKGMVQRLGLAQALVHDPDILILDEPMSGLDPLGRALVKQVIRELKSAGKTIFFSTHITADVESVCDRVAILKQGELQSVDSVNEILLAGLEGYLIHERQHDGSISQRQVKPENLQATLANITKADSKILLVEPCRKSLEQFFLDKIKARHQ